MRSPLILVAFWLKFELTASAEGLLFAARIRKVDGEVAFTSGPLMPLMRIKRGYSLLLINPPQQEVGFTRPITRTLRSLSADAISLDSVQTHHLT